MQFRHGTVGYPTSIPKNHRPANTTFVVGHNVHEQKDYTSIIIDEYSRQHLIQYHNSSINEQSIKIVTWDSYMDGSVTEVTNEYACQNGHTVPTFEQLVDLGFPSMRSLKTNNLLLYRYNTNELLPFVHNRFVQQLKDQPQTTMSECFPEAHLPIASYGDSDLTIDKGQNGIKFSINIQYANPKCSRLNELFVYRTYKELEPFLHLNFTEHNMAKYVSSPSKSVAKSVHWSDVKIQTRVKPKLPKEFIEDEEETTTCQVRFYVDKSGVVRDVEIYKCPVGLHEIVRTATLQWKFAPFEAPSGTPSDIFTFILNQRLEP